MLSADIKETSKYESLVETVEATLNGEPLNLLINNAGMAAKAELDDGVQEDAMIELFRVNSVAPLLLAQVQLHTLIVCFGGGCSRHLVEHCSSMTVVSVMAQQSGRQSLAGGLSLTYT